MCVFVETIEVVYETLIYVLLCIKTFDISIIKDKNLESLDTIIKRSMHEMKCQIVNIIGYILKNVE